MFDKEGANHVITYLPDESEKVEIED